MGVGLEAAGAAARAAPAGPDCLAGVGGEGTLGAGPLSTAGALGAGKTSMAFIPEGTLTSQISKPRTTRCSESEPDMQRLSDFAWEPLSMGRGKGSRCPAGPGGWAPAGHGGEAGSVMRPLLPRLLPFAYGLLRRSESPPTGTRAPAARSIAAA